MSTNLHHDIDNYGIPKAIVKAIEVVQATNLVNSDMLEACEHFMRNESDAKLFVLLDAELQMMWLNKKYLIHPNRDYDY